MSTIPNGSVRFHEGVLERWHSKGRKWLTPSKWVEAETGQSFVPDFSEGKFWGCQFNLYSDGCWTSMYTVFQVASKEVGESYIMNLYNNSSWLNFIVAFSAGSWLLPAWAIFGAPSLGLGEDKLPPGLGQEEVYDNQNWFQWLWWQYLSFDQQIVLMTFIMYYLADPDRKDPDTGESLASQSYLDVFKKFSFGTWRQLPTEAAFEGQDTLSSVIAEYTQYELMLWIIIMTLHAAIWFGVYALGIQPLVKWFCANYHPLGYTISAFNDYDICTLPEYYTYG